MTGCWFRFLSDEIGNEADIVVSKTVTLHSDSLDPSLNGTRKEKPKGFSHNLYPIASIILITSLLECYRVIFFEFSEIWKPLVLMGEKGIIAFFYPLGDVLNRL
jgi:hypothetical protein